jgi:hypothetical protein
MKKVLLGLISIFMAGQISFAQPVSDMAVIPMGITVQSVMRLNVTKGGNIEFVFKSAADVNAGLPSTGAYGTTYETAGTISASQNWDLDLTVDETDFIADNNGGNNLPLNVVSLDVITNAGGTPVTQNDVVLSTPLTLIDANGTNTLGDGLTFNIRWACGVAALASQSVIGTAAGRYSANIILTLSAD